MAPTRLIPLLFVLLCSAGCGVFGRCSNKCPAGFEHDVFCGCFKPDPPKTGGNGNTSNIPTALTPEWVCPVSGSSTEFESWQAEKGFGTNMNGLIGKTVPFASRACDVSAIPFLLQSANCQLDNKGDPFCTTPGTRSVMNVSTVIRKTNLLNGGVAWGVRGTITDRPGVDIVVGSQIEESLTASSLSLNSRLEELSESFASGWERARDAVGGRIRSLALTGAVANAPQSCQIHCQQEDEFCAVATVDQVDLARWQQLITRLNAKPTVIAKKDLIDTANAGQDMCSRSDLTFSPDGRFTNTGESCKMEIPFDGSTVSVSLPSQIAGRLAFPSTSSIEVTFASQSESPAVDFSDKEDHAEFGGVITAMGLSTRALTVATSSGKCIQLRR